MSEEESMNMQQTHLGVMGRGLYRPGEGVVQGEGLEMVRPAFKGCLVHANREVTSLRIIQMTEFMHAHKGSCSYIVHR